MSCDLRRPSKQIVETFQQNHEGLGLHPAMLWFALSSSPADDLVASGMAEGVSFQTTCAGEAQHTEFTQSALSIENIATIDPVHQAGGQGIGVVAGGAIADLHRRGNRALRFCISFFPAFS